MLPEIKSCVSCLVHPIGMGEFYDFDEKVRGPVRRDLKSRRRDFKYQKKKIKKGKVGAEGKGFLGFGRKDLEPNYRYKGKDVVGVPRRGLFSRRKRY